MNLFFQITFRLKRSLVSQNESRIKRIIATDQLNSLTHRTHTGEEGRREEIIPFLLPAASSFIHSSDSPIQITENMKLQRK